MSRIRVVPYRAGSRSATAIARGLRGLCLKVDGTSRFRPRRDDILINWGRSRDVIIGRPPCRVLNRPSEVAAVSDKLLFFMQMRECGEHEIIPEFWTNRNEIPENAYPVVCRTVLNGHSGAGIVLANSVDDLVDAPLYVRYKKKRDEYRIHVGRGREGESIIIAQQAKKRRENHENPNWQVRNHQNGFIYARGGCNPRRCVLDAARHAFATTELDFGAVDVIYNAHEDRAYVLEINTAPGLEGQTVDDYVRFFRENV